MEKQESHFITALSENCCFSNAIHNNFGVYFVAWSRHQWRHEKVISTVGTCENTGSTAIAIAKVYADAIKHYGRTHRKSLLGAGQRGGECNTDIFL